VKLISLKPFALLTVFIDNGCEFAATYGFAVLRYGVAQSVCREDCACQRDGTAAGIRLKDRDDVSVSRNGTGLTYEKVRHDLGHFRDAGRITRHRATAGRPRAG
jgi:hypothetical protein